jgi:hypothetical protein
MEQDNLNVFPERRDGQNLNPSEAYALRMAEERKNYSQDNPEVIDLSEIDGPPAPVAKPIQKIEEPKPIVEKNNTQHSDIIVEPDYGSDFDVIPLPSQGKTYSHKKSAIKVSYLTAADENILTNPNLVKSGKFLDVLFQRKIIDTSFKYEELLTGDKDAIMLWLRATAYGTDYTIQVMDPDELEYFDVDIDLSEIPTKHLGAEPDEEGLFDFELPISKKKLKFKLLTVGDIKNIEAYKDKITQEKGAEYVDLATYTLKTVIVEVDGVRDTNKVNEFCDKMRLGDSRAFKKYVDKIESGKDFILSVTTPGGSQVKTFFPLNSTFFWPES